VKDVPRAIEKESQEQLGYDRIRNNLTESSVRDRFLKKAWSWRTCFFPIPITIPITSAMAALRRGSPK
jgi:hypothetical protein